MTFESIYVMYCFARKVYVKELKVKLFFLIFKHVVKRSHSEAYIMESKKRLEKKNVNFEYFFIGCEHL